MKNTREVAPNVYLIDDELYSIPGSGSVYFLAEERKALIDTGPATSANAVLNGIRQIGCKPEEIDYIVLTHIHLDHAGGAGTLLEKMPRARVVAHHRALKHLIDPSKLVVSALEAQGNGSEGRNGKVLPVVESRLVAAYDGDTIRLSKEQVLTLLEAPGHASHELVISENRNNGLFVGDAVGHQVEGTDVMIPVTPPPSFDLDLYFQTLYRLKDLNPSKMYFAHFGCSDQVQEKLEAAIGKLKERDSVIAAAFRENNPEKAVERLIEHIIAELEVIRGPMKQAYDYWAAVDIPMSAAEHVRYYRKKFGV
jgi:glyoxylase-like metal-dependent hydrolase (beta-lactamase superfamily II)